MSNINRFSIIKANLTHVAYLAEFAKQSFIDAYSCALTDDELEEYTQEVFSKNTIENEISNSLANYFVCQDSNKSYLCGYLKLIKSEPPKYIPRKNSIEIQRLYVSQEYKGFGVASKLYKRAIKYAKDKQLEGIFLRVWEKNPLAISIYKKWGYSILGQETYQVSTGSGIVHVMYKGL